MALLIPSGHGQAMVDPSRREMHTLPSIRQAIPAINQAVPPDQKVPTATPHQPPSPPYTMTSIYGTATPTASPQRHTPSDSSRRSPSNRSSSSVQPWESFESHPQTRIKSEQPNDDYPGYHPRPLEPEIRVNHPGYLRSPSYPAANGQQSPYPVEYGQLRGPYGGETMVQQRPELPPANSLDPSRPQDYNPNINGAVSPYESQSRFAAPPPSLGRPMSGPISPTFPTSPHESQDSAQFTQYTANSSHFETQRRRRGNLPREVTDKLRKWYADNAAHPYPNEEEKQMLIQQTGLSMPQISNWFINARRRQPKTNNH